MFSTIRIYCKFLGLFILSSLTVRMKHSPSCSHKNDNVTHTQRTHPHYTTHTPTFTRTHETKEIESKTYLPTIKLYIIYICNKNIKTQKNKRMEEGTDLNVLALAKLGKRVQINRRCILPSNDSFEAKLT